jgi:hypothetical protein
MRTFIQIKFLFSILCVRANVHMFTILHWLQATCWAPARRRMCSHGGAQVASIVVAPLPAPHPVGPRALRSITGSHIWAGGLRSGSQDLAHQQRGLLQDCYLRNSNNNSNSSSWRARKAPSHTSRHSRNYSKYYSKKRNLSNCGERMRNR